MPNLQEIIGVLLQEIESDHFVFRFGDRTSLSGPGLGFRGVRDRRLVLVYLDALERLHNAMTGPICRTRPVVGKRGKTMVYVFDSSDVPPFYGSPFTDVDLDGVPYIGLQARTNEPTIDAALQRARAEATHEGTHVFNFRERHPHDPYTGPWVWFDEGTAIFLESHVFAGNPDTLRYAMNWVDRPEASLDDWAYRYESGIFVRYLVHREGLQFLSDVWMKALRGEAPLQTIGRLLGTGDSGIHELFREYCVESFFLWDHRGLMFQPEVYTRYGERAVVERFDLRPESIATRDLAVPRLACHYHRLQFAESVLAVRIQVSSLSPHMAFDVIPVGLDGTRGARRSLTSGIAVDLPTDNVNHFIVVTSNCHTVGGTISYRLELSAY